MGEMHNLRGTHKSPSRDHNHKKGIQTGPFLANSSRGCKKVSKKMCSMPKT